jgi:hypothetical protein
MVYVTNAFSLNMLPDNCTVANILVTKISLDTAREFLKRNTFQSYIGHADLASIASNLLGVPLEVNRQTLTVKEGDAVLVVQYRGPRLPEGTTTLPEGATLEFWLVDIFVEDTEGGDEDVRVGSVQ